jgi:hypothetical protein
MKLKQFFIAHNVAVDRELLLRLLSKGLTSMLRRPSAAFWQLAGRTLVGQHAYEAMKLRGRD